MDPLGEHTFGTTVLECLNPEQHHRSSTKYRKIVNSYVFTKTKSPGKRNDRDDNNNRPDIVILDKTNKEAYLIDVAVPNSHNLHNTITEKLQKYTDLKDDVI